jgi:hypothetical protein
VEDERIEAMKQIWMQMVKEGAGIVNPEVSTEITIYVPHYFSLLLPSCLTHHPLRIIQR